MKETKIKIELRLTVDEKVELKIVAAKNNMKVNQYVMHLVRKDQKEQ